MVRLLDLNPRGPRATQSGHQPLPTSLAHSGTGAIMIRDPMRRLVSAWGYRHAVGMSTSDRKQLMRLGRNAPVKTIRDFVKFRGVSGCQVKMLIGRACAAVYNVTVDDVETAKSRLESVRQLRHHCGSFLTHFSRISLCYHRTVCALAPTKPHAPHAVSAALRSCNPMYGFFFGDDQFASSGLRVRGDHRLLAVLDLPLPRNARRHAAGREFCQCAQQRVANEPDPRRRV